MLLWVRGETMIQLIPVSAKNKEEILKLSLLPSQTHFIESVEDCLKEADALPLWKPVGIYDDETLIGFAMYGLWKTEGDHGRVWLDRFLIDQSQQKKGYGKKALIALIQHIFNHYDDEEVYLSLYEDNTVALHLYKKLGFLFNGEKDIHNEQIMVLKKTAFQSCL